MKASADVEIELVHSRTPEAVAAFAAEHGIARTTTDYDVVLNDPRVDIVYLATPFATHHAMASAALLAGKHVLVEKPIAMSAHDASDLFETAAHQQRFLMEAMWTKFNPSFRQLRTALGEGRIGEPRSLRAGFGFPFPANGSKWDVARSGGALLDQAIYPVTLAHAVFGEPDSIHARGSLREDGLDLTEHFTLEYTDGRFAQAAASISEFIDGSASISGTTGWITLPVPFWVTTSFTSHTADLTGFAPPVVFEVEQEGNGYIPMIRAVTAAMRDGLLEHPLHTAADTVAVFRTLDEIHRQIAPAKQAAR